VSLSRYANVGQAVWTASDGRQIPYLRRRLLPAPGTMGTRSLHQVMPGERVDTIANSELGDATLSWMLADANLGARPTQLTQPVGRLLIVPLPAGVPGASSGQ
jgi:hypothetical protein